MQDANPPASSWHWNVELASLEENVKLAELVLTVPDGPEPIVVSGGVTSGGGGVPEGRRARAAPMLRPAMLAIAVRVPVAPAAACVASDDEASASRVLVGLGEAASQRSTIPPGGLSVPSAFTAAKWTNNVPGTG